MQKTYKATLVLFFIFISFSAKAQLNTFSPYSRYGFGELYSGGFGFSKAMGGVGIGTRLNNQINYLNPAGYTVQDSLTFLLDLGFSLSNTVYETSSVSEKRRNAEFDHLAISFPITKSWIVCLGATPYSKVGYNLKATTNATDIGEIVTNFKGTGGLNRYFIGSAYKYKNLSFGFNANYLLGSLDISNAYSILPNENDIVNPVESSYSTSISDKYLIHDMSFGFGVQYDIVLNSKMNMVLGITYEPKNKITADRELFASSNFPYQSTYASYNWDFTGFREDTVIDKNNLKSTFNIPAKIGIGASLDISQKLLVCLDYSRQDWSGYNFPMSGTDGKINLSLSQSYNLGFQYTPNKNAIRGYLNHVNFRLGGYLSDTYMSYRDSGKKLKDYGMSFGLGLPFLNSRSAFTINYEIGQRGTTDNKMVRESYQFVYVGLTLTDFWFIKSKFD